METKATSLRGGWADGRRMGGDGGSGGVKGERGSAGWLGGVWLAACFGCECWA